MARPYAPVRAIFLHTGPVLRGASGVMLRPSLALPEVISLMGTIVRIGVIILCVAALYWLVIQLGEGFAG